MNFWLRTMGAVAFATGLAAAAPAWAAAGDEVQVTRAALLKAAQQSGLSDRPDVVEKLRRVQEEVLIRVYHDNFLAGYVATDAELQRAYDTLQARSGNTEYRVHHLFVTSQADAQRALERLNKGERFEQVATEMSQDITTRQRGGDLGWLSPSAIQSHLLPAVSALKKGQYTRQPVEGKGGWHLIALDDSRPYNWPTLDQIKPQLRENLAAQAWLAHVNQLRQAGSKK